MTEKRSRRCLTDFPFIYKSDERQAEMMGSKWQSSSPNSKKCPRRRKGAEEEPRRKNPAKKETCTGGRWRWGWWKCRSRKSVGSEGTKNIQVMLDEFVAQVIKHGFTMSVKKKTCCVPVIIVCRDSQLTVGFTAKRTRSSRRKYVYECDDHQSNSELFWRRQDITNSTSEGRKRYLWMSDDRLHVLCHESIGKRSQSMLGKMKHHFTGYHKSFAFVTAVRSEGEMDFIEPLEALSMFDHTRQDWRKKEKGMKNSGR